MNFSTSTDQLESADVGNGDNQARPSQEKARKKGGRARTYSVHTAMKWCQKQLSIGTKSAITILGLNGGQKQP